MLVYGYDVVCMLNLDYIAVFLAPSGIDDRAVKGRLDYRLFGCGDVYVWMDCIVTLRDDSFERSEEVQSFDRKLSSASCGYFKLLFRIYSFLEQ